jgi:uncharacterized caspase-like protein
MKRANETRWPLVRALAVAVLCLVSAGAGAETESRIALVIGNGGYQHLARLPNPANDAQLIATTLRSLGFTLIGGRERTDLDRAEFEQAIREFGNKLSGDAVGLFYYAGHGVQIQGINYLVPVGANPTSTADVDFELIDADLVLKQMKAAGSKLNFVILDACRNNPFGGRGLRTTGGGLAQMRAPTGTLISYATQPGSVAMDGIGNHSPYAIALAEAMRRPGLRVLDVFNDVGLAVDKATRGQQTPWQSSSPIEGNFYFFGPTTGTIQPSPPASLPAANAELVFWQSISSSATAADFEEYVRKYPNGQFAGLARNRLAALRLSPSPVTQQPGLEIRDITVGDGAVASNGLNASLHYTGWLWKNGAKGAQFDSSRITGKPLTFKLGAHQVIAGWDQGISWMKVGGQRTLLIPPELGYGAKGAGGIIPPNATLYFEVELVSVR